MNPAVLFLILSSVAISALAQICLKHGMSSDVVQSALSGSNPMEIAVAVGTNPFIVGGLTLYALGAILWLGVLARIDVSLAYPFVAVGFLFTMVLSVLVLGEPLTVSRVLGTTMIVLGVVVLVRA